MISEKILLVDDEQEMLNSLSRLMHDDQVDTALSGQQALELMANSGPYALIISDLKMPGMDGATLLAKAQELYPDTVRIMLTGAKDMVDVIDVVNRGYVFRFLSKPASMKEVFTAIDDGLAQHRRIVAERELAITQRLHSTLEKVVGGFVRVLEARDPYTAGHQRRVAQLAEAIALRMGHEQIRAQNIRMAAMIHDLGKVYVPAEFLNKPGQLSSLEMEIIRAHPRVGREILAPLGFDWPIAEIVGQHHERVDGTGYPDGLRGAEILVEAKIIAVADVVEAISSHRPYRPAHTLEEALDELRQGRGKIYDSDIVDCCLRLFQDDHWTFGE